MCDILAEWNKKLWSCIAHPCKDEREKGSAFCAVHKTEHAKLTWRIPRQKVADPVEPVIVSETPGYDPKKDVAHRD